MRRILALAFLLWASSALAGQFFSGANIGGAPPADSIGHDYDWYLDANSGNLWGPKAFGHWPTPAFGTLLPVAGGNNCVYVNGASPPPGCVTTLPSGLTIPAPTVSGAALFPGTISGASSGTAPSIYGLPNLSASVEGIGTAGLDNANWFIYQRADTLAQALVQTLRVQRNAEYSSTATQNTAQTIWALEQSSIHGGLSEWTTTSALNNTTLGIAGAWPQNVAINGTANKVQFSLSGVVISVASPAVISSSSIVQVQAGDQVKFASTGTLPTGLSSATTYYVISSGLTSNSFEVSTSPGGSAVNTTSAGTGTYSFTVQGEIGFTWGADFVCNDETGIVNPQYSCIGTEIDNYHVLGAGADPAHHRVILQLAAGNPSGSAGGSGDHTGYGILMGANDSSSIDRGIYFGGSGVYGYGIDFTAASVQQAAIILAPAQKIALDGATSGNFARSIYYNTGSLVYQTQNGNIFTVSDTGVVTAGTAYQSPTFYGPDGSSYAMAVSDSTSTNIVKLLTTTSNMWIGASNAGATTTIVSSNPVAIKADDGTTDLELTAAKIQLSAAAPTVSSGQIGYGGTTAAASSCGSLSGSGGCIVVNISGNNHYVPYY